MRFRTWNIGSLYRTGSLKAVASELVKYNLDLVEVQEVIWVEGSSQPADMIIHFFYVNGDAYHHLEQHFSNIRESYQQLKG
jgi:hypothetical protein